MVYSFYGDNMKKKKWILVIGLLIVIVILAYSRKNTSNQTVDNSIEFNESMVVSQTKNLFAIAGNFISSALSKLIGVVFSIINKVLEFIFGI